MFGESLDLFLGDLFYVDSVQLQTQPSLEF
ncbi:hypothetical protein H4W79_001498 [Nocardiopsis terrae]|uniref:Uncharacterized protein n=1 Tax=Nocardiopsis terrae TaxID=372655 RepID=A0ABR9HE30_9ACTN|nr:hypothetical protein [Nocardiopsis terrae]